MGWSVGRLVLCIACGCVLVGLCLCSLSGWLLIVLVSCFYMCLFVVFICRLLCGVSCFGVDVVSFVMVCYAWGVCGLCLFVLFVGLLCLFVGVGFGGW